MIINILHKALLATNKNNKNNNVDSNNPLTFTAEDAGSTIKLTTIGSLNVPDGLEYRTNINSDWSTYNINTTITLTKIGDYVQFQNTKEQLNSNSLTYTYFKMSGKIAASGNIQSMLNYSTSCPAYCYFGLFEYCSGLTSAPGLPATNLADGCYRHMFGGCTSLTKAPKLPATNLAPHCYHNMFGGCTSLTNAPELPATNLAKCCYYGMFSDCTSLNYVNVGFTDWYYDKYSSTFATDGWLRDVSPTGTFVCPEELDTTQRGNSYIPTGWTIDGR
jgi:hypothetical protein